MRPLLLGAMLALSSVAVSTAAEPTGSLRVKETPAAVQSAAVQARRTVVYLLLDGFRYDYVDRFALPNLLAIRKEGVAAPDGVMPSYPSVSGPNHVALMTGLYPTHSGIVANGFRDVARGETYAQIGVPASDDGAWYRGVPLWEAAERAGIRTAGIFWNGAGIESHGIRMTRYAPFADENIKLEGKPQVTLFRQWLDLPSPERPRFFTIVFGQADHAGHSHGPDSPEVAAAAREIDGQIGAMRAALAERKIEADIVIVADHGMAPVAGDWVNLDQFVDLSGVETVGSMLYPATEADRERIYEGLKGKSPAFDVYRRKDLPPALHYRDNPLTGDPVIVPRGPYLIRARQEGGTDQHPGLEGMHGPWVGDTHTMRGVFGAVGPSFRPGVEIEPFRNVDLYPMLAALLGVQVPASDGTCVVADRALQPKVKCKDGR